MKLIMIIIFFISSFNCFCQNYLRVDELDLNRTATPLSKTQQNKFPFSHTGFQWNSGDNKTKKWRP